MNSTLKIAVVIPAYKVTNQILGVLTQIGPEVDKIYVIDDNCPDGSGKVVNQNCNDARVEVLFNSANQGVGGATMVGYQAAIVDNMDIIVKIDGDGQMNPALIPQFVEPITSGYADYTKGNRFFNLEDVLTMPKIRIFGNAILSFVTKISSGYWNLFDPTNGFTAIHRDVASYLPFEKISQRYFFETDMLFRLNTLRAVVVEVPMVASYGNEKSGLHISKILIEFIYKHIRNFVKRLIYNYYLRNMSLASIELPIGILMMVFGIVFGAYNWLLSLKTGIFTPPGTVMLSALPLLVGIQLVLAFLSYDISSVPRVSIHQRLLS